MEAPNRSEPWHFDKKVPLTLMFFMLVQTIGVIWWAASLSTRVDHQDRQIVGLVQAEQQTKLEARRIGEWLSRVDERIAAQTEMLRRVEQSVLATRTAPQQGTR
jgi:hypothetical protein